MSWFKPWRRRTVSGRSSESDRDRIADEPCTAGREGPAQRPLADVQIKIRHRTAAEDRAPIRRCRPLPGPGLQIAIDRAVPQHFARGVEQGANASRRNRVARGPDFDEPGHAHAILQRRKYHLATRVGDRSARHGSVQWLDRDRIALQWIDGQCDPGSRGDASRLKAGGENIGIGAQRRRTVPRSRQRPHLIPLEVKAFGLTTECELDTALCQ